MRWLAAMFPPIFLALIADASADEAPPAGALPPLPPPSSEAPTPGPPSQRPAELPGPAQGSDGRTSLGGAPALPGQVPCVCPTPKPEGPRRDGFYLRASLGWAFMSSFGDGPAGSASQHGDGPGFSLSIGGTPVRRLALAATFRFITVGGSLDGYAPVGSMGSSSTSGSGTLIQIGLLADWYPDVASGWHAGASVALSGLNIDVGSTLQALGSGSAAGGTVFGGYEWGTGGNWSLGLMAVLASAGRTSLRDSQGSDVGYTLMPIAFAIEGTALFY